jgi:hypothetical protein
VKWPPPPPPKKNVANGNVSVLLDIINTDLLVRVWFSGLEHTGIIHLEYNLIRTLCMGLKQPNSWLLEEEPCLWGGRSPYIFGTKLRKTHQG